MRAIITHTDKSERFYEEANRKASNNDERQAYMRPSEFGFDATSDGTHACVELLKRDSRFKKIEIIGQDLLDITLY